jgi:ATP-dependent helicase HrpB
LARYEFVRSSLPELGWPELGEPEFQQLLPRLCEGCREVAQVRQAAKVPLLEDLLAPAQRRELNQSAPAALRIPSGRLVNLIYEPGRPPVLAARIQELFGWKETPRVARGRVPILLHLLAPNHRPAQITSDLASFWATTYHQVRKELRGRYPKHDWPENPQAAQPRSNRRAPS